MALITDPDDLAQGSEITINTTTKKISLNIAGALSADGVTGQCLYSFLKEEWKGDNSLIPFEFPMVAITPEQFEFVEDWEPTNDATRKLIRQAGWREIDDTDVVKREYMGVVSLGNIDSTSKTVGDKAYYAFAGDSSKTDFTYAGPVDEAVQTYGDSSNGNFDSRATVFTVYIRQQGKTFDQITSTAIGLSSLSYITYRFPLSEGTDLKISASDVTIAGSAPYTSMGIEFFSSAQSKTMGASNYNFGIVVDSNSGTAKQVYEFIQYQLRQDSDIDDGTGSQNGYLADSMAVFVGDRLDTLSAANAEGGGTGVFLDDINATSINDVRFIDNTETYRTYPYVAAGTISFNGNLVNDSGPIYKMFFTTNPGGNFGTSSAIVVDDNSGTDIAGAIASGSVAFTFDYDGNVQGGRTAGTDADVTVVAIGLDTAQYVAATGTITRSNANSVSLVAALERNYSNP